MPKEAYEEQLIPAFRKYWKEKTGRDVVFQTSYVASGTQARAIVNGLEADVAALSLEGDMDLVTKARPDLRQQAACGSSTLPGSLGKCLLSFRTMGREPEGRRRPRRLPRAVRSTGIRFSEQPAG